MPIRSRITSLLRRLKKHRYVLRKTVSKHLNKLTDFMLSTPSVRWPLINCIKREYCGTERETPSLVLGVIWISPKLFLHQFINPWNYRKFVPEEVRKLLLSITYWLERIQQPQEPSNRLLIWQPSSKYSALFGLPWGSRAWAWWRFNQSIKTCARLRNEASKTVYL